MPTTYRLFFTSTIIISVTGIFLALAFIENWDDSIIVALILLLSGIMGGLFSRHPLIGALAGLLSGFLISTFFLALARSDFIFVYPGAPPGWLYLPSIAGGSLGGFLGMLLLRKRYIQKEFSRRWLKMPLINTMQ